MVIDRDETASCQSTDNPAAASNDIPSWIRDCIKGIIYTNKVCNIHDL